MAAIVQKGDAGNVGSTITVTMPGATTTGNALAIIIRNPGADILSIGDGTNTFDLIQHVSTGFVVFDTYRVKSLTGTSGDIVITVSGGGDGSWWAYVWEVSGCDATDPLDTNVVTATDFVNDMASDPITTTRSGAVFMGGTVAGAGTTYSAGTNYTLDAASLGPSGGSFGTEHRITTGPLSSEAQHITTSNGGFHAGVAVIAFKDVAGPSQLTDARIVISSP